MSVLLSSIVLLLFSIAYGQYQALQVARFGHRQQDWMILGWPAFSSTRIGRWASRAAAATTSTKSASLTWYEHEQVTRIPPGRSIFRARRLSSLYPRKAVSRACFALGKRGRVENDGVVLLAGGGIVLEQSQRRWPRSIRSRGRSGRRSDRRPPARGASCRLRSPWSQCPAR